MAAQTLVVLDSSSPPAPALRHPSSTPQKSADATSSSPGLPDVSTFFKANGRALNPAPALSGFASAGTLWKEAAREEAERRDRVGRSNAAERTSTGISASPVKRAQKEGRSGVGGQARASVASISLSEVGFRTDEEGLGEVHTSEGGRKVGKRSVKAKDEDGSGEARKTPKTETTSIALPSNAAGKVTKQSEKADEDQQFALFDKTRKPSISMPDFSYELRDATPVEEFLHKSTSFSTSASRASPSPNPASSKQTAPTGLSSKDVLPDVGPVVLGVTGEAEAPETLSKPAHRGSISLSAFEYRAQENDPAAGRSEAQPKTTKKPRKRPAVSKGASRTGPARKPKKRFAKSESIVLDSDDTDATHGDIPHGLGDRMLDVPPAEAVSVASKAKKPPTKINVVGAVAANLDLTRQPEFGVWSQSVYFNSESITRTVESGATVESLQTVFAANGDVQAASLQHANVPERHRPPRTQTANPQRQSWTPVKNTYEAFDPEVDSSGDSPAPRKSLADLVGDFCYSEQVQSRTRSPVGEPLTKKRRIQVGDDTAGIPLHRKAVALKEKVKKVKAAKKKPQTITDLATKAYRADEEEAPNDQSTVSEFFKAQKDDCIATAAATAVSKSMETSEVPPTFKKPRKPRARKADDAASASKKTPKPKQVKVKFNEPPVLLSPQKARAQEKKQGFLFGTSSQLALGEDVAYVRDLQMAIQESEAVEGEQSSPKRTKVSVGQAGRRLFWSASRDFEGHVVAANGYKRNVGVVVVPGAVGGEEHSMRPIVVAAESVAHKHSAVFPDETSKRDCFGGGARLSGEGQVGQVVDFCGTSPVSASEEQGHLIQDIEQPVAPIKTASAPTASEIDDTWMLLESDDTDADDHTGAVSTIMPHNVISRELSSTIAPVARSASPAVSPIRGPAHFRTALTALDCNIAILAQKPPTEQKRAFASQASPAGLNHTQARLPKNSTSTSAAALSPKRRGRPPKPAGIKKRTPHELPASSASQVAPRSSDFVAIDDISDSEAEDVSLKNVCAAKPELPSPKRRGRPPKTPQSQSSPSKSSFVNLEDISDSDATKQTPSPRRRKATPCYPVRTLELSPSVSGQSELPPVVEGKAAIKPTDPCWLGISQTLFPQISAVVRSTKPCRDGGELSWWEKILMFDPIVIEDITAWLVERGVVVEVRRKAIKAKKAGRKKKKKEKGDIEDEGEEEEEVGDGFEVKREELKGWMVQKWCEEKSICCLWKEGLRGGVRVRY